MGVATAAASTAGTQRALRSTTDLGSLRDSAAFGQLYEQTVDSVYRYALVLVRDRDRAEDVAADVYLKAWKNRLSLRDGAAALPWLLSITHNVAISMLRASREVADVDLIEEREDLNARTDTALFAEADAASLQSAMRRLTPEQQQVVFLRFFEDLPHDVVAARLNRNPNAIRAIQFRALSRLRKLLEVSVERTA